MPYNLAASSTSFYSVLDESNLNGFHNNNNNIDNDQPDLLPTSSDDKNGASEWQVGKIPKVVIFNETG